MRIIFSISSSTMNSYIFFSLDKSNPVLQACFTNSKVGTTVNKIRIIKNNMLLKKKNDRYLFRIHNVIRGGILFSFSYPGLNFKIENYSTC